MTTNYELVVHGMTTHFFPIKVIKCQQRYLRQGLFKTQYFNIFKFISLAINIVGCLEYFAPFGTSRGLQDNKII